MFNYRIVDRSGIKNQLYRATGLLCIVALVCLFILSSCTDETLVDSAILKPNGNVASYNELSAGTATVFLSSDKAYDNEASWVTGDLLHRFNSGDALYDDPRNSDSNPSVGGLGPLYVGFSCGSCHKNAGRTSSTLFTEGGSGKSGFSSCLAYISRKNGGFFRQYGRVLHDQSIYGTKPEGKLSVTYTEEQFTFTDGESYLLQTPHYTITEWYADSIRPEDLYITVRIPLRHIGLGQMMSLDPTEIEKLAVQSNYPEYGISGRANYITERGKKMLGITGNKAQHADLTVELGFSSDLGVTNDRYPEEVGEGQQQSMYHNVYGIQISTEDMEDVDLYLHTLGVPARRYVNNTTVKQGEENFYKAKCNLCHVPTLHTKNEPTVLLNGTSIPWLANQVIHPYSDFLLHDMGAGLDDHYQSGLANGNEWRTTPLWGIGLQYTVNGHTQFLHDGRARNLTEAIMWHGGEGAVSRELFRRMSKEDRNALVMFLESL